MPEICDAILADPDGVMGGFAAAVPAGLRRGMGFQVAGMLPAFGCWREFMVRRLSGPADPDG